MSCNESGFAYMKSENSNLYECPCCERKYGTPREMANCIFKCEAEREEIEVKKRREELLKQKESRKNEIKKQWDRVDEERSKAVKMEEKYYKDYGEGLYFANYGIRVDPEFSVKDLTDELFKTMKMYQTIIT